MCCLIFVILPYFKVMGRLLVNNRPPAYKDRSLVNRPREKWADIPGLDGYYEVSNVGRVKRLEREVPYVNGTVHHLPGKILAPRVQRTLNEYKRDYTYQLNIPLRVGGVTCHLQIRRLVYHCFVAPIALDDQSLLVVSKKGDGLDIRPGNLLLVRRSERTAGILQQQRRVSYLSPEHQKMGNAASVQSTAKEVSQYTAKGKLVQTFISIMDAARATGIQHPRISHAVTGREVTAGGYYWQYGHKKRMDLAVFWEQRKAGYQQRGTPISQYDLEGNFLAGYSSIREAAGVIGVDSTGISANLRGVTRTAYGFRWQYGQSKRRLKSPPK